MKNYVIKFQLNMNIDAINLNEAIKIAYGKLGMKDVQTGDFIYLDCEEKSTSQAFNFDNDPPII